MKKKGFTLIELVVVMAIIAVLALLVTGAIILARRTSVETTNRSNAKTIQTALEAYYAKNRQYPTFSNASFATVEASNVWTTGGVNAPKLITSCGVTGSAQEKGGKVTSTSNTYTIDVYNWDCSTPMTNDQIVVP